MFHRYKTSIEDYCSANGIEIPIGFQRHEASRYAAIDLKQVPPRLVAATWSKEADAINYLQKLDVGHRTLLLDFKDRCEMTFNGGTSLFRGTPF